MTLLFACSVIYLWRANNDKSFLELSFLPDAPSLSTSYGIVRVLMYGYAFCSSGEPLFWPSVFWLPVGQLHATNWNVSFNHCTLVDQIYHYLLTPHPFTVTIPIISNIIDAPLIVSRSQICTYSWISRRIATSPMATPLIDNVLIECFYPTSNCYCCNCYSSILRFPFWPGIAQAISLQGCVGDCGYMHSFASYDFISNWQVG